MSYFTMDSILGANISENDLNEEQKLILKAYNDVKALNLFNTLFRKWYFSEYHFAGAPRSETPRQNFTKIWRPKKSKLLWIAIFELYAREEWKICIQEIVYEGSTNQKGSLTTDAQLSSGFHSAPVVPCATGTAVLRKGGWRGKFLGMKQFFFDRVLCQANLIQVSI